MTDTESDEALLVSVVIPSIGRDVLAEIVARCLSEDPLEVVVVADANPDTVTGVLERADLLADSRVRVVAGPGRGVALARQAGVDAVRGDLVLILDDDVVPEPGLLAGHRRIHEAQPDRVVVGYMPVAPHLVAKSVTAAIYSGDYESECRVLDADPLRVLLQFWAGNFSMRRADCDRVPQAVATYAESLLEDEEFGFRCHAAGLVGVFDRSLGSFHHYRRPVRTFLVSARAQMVAARRLHGLYPGLMAVTDGRRDLPKAAQAVVWMSTRPGIGRLVRAAIVRAATQLGAGPPTRMRVRAVVLARVVVQSYE